MAFEVVDLREFLTDDIFFEDRFLEKADSFDWSRFQDKKVLVRGCSSAIIPPWAFMVLAARLMPVAESVRFGNEHDHVVVYRRKK